MDVPRRRIIDPPGTPSSGAGVRAILRELQGPRNRGDTVGGTVTSLERAMAQGLVAIESGKFVLTEGGLNATASQAPDRDGNEP
jgi:hypothetical protein